MSISIKTSITDGISIPLSVEVHQLATKWAGEQHGLAKGKRVYLNTLAVVALHTYLCWLDLSSDLDASYSWHPLQRSTFDRADLYIPDIGRIDCVLALPGEKTAESPLASEDTIAQVLVQFDESLASVRLTGYCLVVGEPEEEVSTDPKQGWFEIEQLPETLLRLQMAFDYLEMAEDEETQQLREEMAARELNWSGVMTILMVNWDKPILLRRKLRTFLGLNSSSQHSALVTLRSPQDEPEEDDWSVRLAACLGNIRDAIEDVLNPSSSIENEPVNTIIRFRDWRRGNFGQGWEPTETLLGDRHRQLAARSTAGNGLERSKFYDLGVAIVGYAIVLTVELIPDSPTSSQAKVRITTAQGIPYLPPQLKLAILNEDETPALTAQGEPMESVSRERDTWIQRTLFVDEAEIFKVKIALDEFSLIETFEA